MGKKRMVILAAAFAVFFLSIVSFASAEDKEITRMTLRGIKEVNVVIESIEPEIQSLGLTQDQVKADVKELIEIFADNGGLIVDASTTGPPPESIPENVSAMTDAVFEYGVF